MTSFFALILSALLVLSYICSFSKARAVSERSGTRLRSLPRYHGTYGLLWALIPIIVVSFAWNAVEPAVLRTAIINALPQSLVESKDRGVLLTEVENVASGSLAEASADAQIVSAAQEYRLLKNNSRWLFWITLLLASFLGGFLAFRQISPEFSARAGVEKIFKATLLLCSCIAILTTIGIICSLIFESARFFQRISIFEFLFGLKWSPQIAMRTDQVASGGAFGSVSLLVGTMLIAFIAMSVATPLGLLSAIYLTEYASRQVRSVAKPVLEILAGIPTVVYGFFAVKTVAPALQALGVSVGLDVSSESALAAGLVMGIMIIPFVSSLSDDVINAVPQALRDGSYALGATKSETIKHVVVPAALPGIMGAVLLALSRAIGETMIVVMAAGLTANLSINPLENVTTVTVQIVTILIGDQEFDSPKTLAAFALGLQLFFITLALNVIALRIVKRYREKYE